MGSPSFVRSAGLVSACILLSRILGFVRDVLCSHFIGAGMAWDMFVVAFRIPNLFRRLFGEGALTAAFLPAFVERAEGERQAEARGLLARLVGVLGILLSLLVAAGIGITWLLPADPENALLARLLRIMLPYLGLICVAAILGAALNGLRHYFTPAFAPVLLNVVWIGALLAFSGSVEAVAWAVLIGGVLELAIMLPALARRKMLSAPRLDLKDPALREVGAQFLPLVFGLALVQINEAVGSIIAKEWVPGDGAVSAIYYGNQLVQLPLALIGTAMATAVFPLFTSPKEVFEDVFLKSLRIVLFLAVPAAVGLVVLARPLVELLFEHGAFKPEATARAAGVVVLYAAGLWCYCANQIQARAFYAKKDTRTPVRVSATMVFLNLGLSLALVGPMGERGIALANSATGLATFVALNVLLARRFPGIELRPAYRALLRTALAAVLMGAAAWGASRLMGGVGGATIAAKLARALVPVAAGVATYALLARLLLKDELGLLLRRAHDDRRVPAPDPQDLPRPRPETGPG
jgi:putative peptidoglycan lipid II flippase